MPVPGEIDIDFKVCHCSNRKINPFNQEICSSTDMQNC